jgi:hypothetical protein
MKIPRVMIRFRLRLGRVGWRGAIHSPRGLTSQTFHPSVQSHLPLCVKMSKAAAPYRDSTDLPRPPPSYEPTTAPAGPSEPLLGDDRGRHSEDDIPDDFK